VRCHYTCSPSSAHQARRLSLSILHRFLDHRALHSFPTRRSSDLRHGDDLETRRGDWVDWWSDGVASSAYETGVNRTTHELLLAADRKSTRLNSSHVAISYAVFCLKKKKN